MTTTPDPPFVALVDWALAAEVNQCIVVEQEDSVRADWWRASCLLHDWYTTGSRYNVENGADEHVADNHPACSAASDRTFLGTPLYCHIQPDHLNGHMNQDYIWPRTKDAEMPEPEITIPVTVELSPAGAARPPGADRYTCPISTCDWHYDAPPPPNTAPEFLAEFFGPGVMAVQATNLHLADIEKRLREHFESHTMPEWLAETMQLKNLSMGLARQLGEMTEDYRIASTMKIPTGPATKIIINALPTDIDEG